MKSKPKEGINYVLTEDNDKMDPGDLNELQAIIDAHGGEKGKAEMKTEAEKAFLDGDV